MDAVLVTHLPNIQYLCGFTGSSGMLLVEADRATLFTDSRYTFQCREEVSGAAVKIVSGGLVRAVGEVLRPRRGTSHGGVFRRPGQRGAEARLGAAAGKRVRWVPGAARWSGCAR